MDLVLTCNSSQESHIYGLIFIVFLFVPILFYYTDRPCPEITEECLTCLCEAVSDCDFRIMCNRKENSCGAFLITYGFWLDGGEQESKKNTLDGLERK